MIVLFAILGLVLAAVTVRLALPSVRRWRMAAELRRDWWPRFERELRAYERDWRLTMRERRT
jgi:predicted exporter